MKAKKHLGQNFLKSKVDIIKIVSLANLSEKDLVLEIGPGKGALTSEILKTNCHLLAFEKDGELLPQLQEKFAQEIRDEKLFLIQKDILSIDIEKEIKNIFKEKKDYKIIANIPYYITGGILRKFLEENHQPKQIFLITQREVAKRITDKEKSSILSLSIEVYGRAKYIKTIKAKNFSPMPKVDSAILEINDISKDFFTKNKIKERNFFNFIKKSFQFKRKTLVKNLEKEYSKKNIKETLKKLSLEEGVRGEDLKLENFLKLYKKLN